MAKNMKSITHLPIKSDKPWIILGKGPSFNRILDINTNQYYTFCLNHTMSIVDGDIGHIIDLEVLDEIEDVGCFSLIVPYHPHINSKPTKRNLRDWIKEKPILQYYEKFGKLFTYNLSTWKLAHLKDYPIVLTRYFSAETAFRILIAGGAKVIYSLGIDGGTEYSSQFKNLKPLRNGRRSFDDQFKEINSIVRESGVTYHAL